MQHPDWPRARAQRSAGLCSPDELGLGSNHEWVFVTPAALSRLGCLGCRPALLRPHRTAPPPGSGAGAGAPGGPVCRLLPFLGTRPRCPVGENRLPPRPVDGAPCSVLGRPQAFLRRLQGPVRHSVSRARLSALLVRLSSTRRPALPLPGELHEPRQGWTAHTHQLPITSRLIATALCAISWAPRPAEAWTHCPAVTAERSAGLGPCGQWTGVESRGLLPAGCPHQRRCC